ncbi:MAG: TlpA disulfide reductase family protein [Flavipsychrobacter sp.]|nr:TlpA disulfide reductase family protein [Flavipsychrobacter sp.]
MRSKLLLLLFIAFCFIESCKIGGNGKFTVSGTIQNIPPCTVVLEELGVNDVITELDSDKIEGDGKFDLSGNAPEPGIYRLHFSHNKFIMLSIDKGDIKINADWSALERSQITGSAATVSLQQFLTGVRSNMRDFNTMNIVLDTLQAKGNDSVLALAKADMKRMQEKFTKFVENYADTTTYLPNAIFAARVLNVRAERDFLNAFTQSLSRRFPNQPKVKDFESFYAQVLGGSKQKTVVPQGMIGGIAPELKLPEVNGAVVGLSSLRGKYVLLDFWASWCGPCRAENPNVVSAYNKYKDKNFTIYSVSLDNNKDNWEKAIKDDNLSWPTQVSDLAGWNSAAAKTYNIESIPSNFLIDPSGKIIARDLRGDLLDQKLSSILK